MIDKTVASFDEAVADVQDGSMLLIGGFGSAGGCPSNLIKAVARRGVRDLTVVGNSGGWGTDLDQVRRNRATMLLPDGFMDISILLENDQVTRGILTFPAISSPGAQSVFEKKYDEGKVKLEFLGQGTLSARLRAARGGIPAFYTPAGVGTVVAEGKEVREFDGRPHLLEYALKGDYALVRAHQADRYGNLVYRGTSRTLNATMAGAAGVTIAEVDEIVDPAELDPECIVTHSVFVDRVVQIPRGDAR